GEIDCFIENTIKDWMKSYDVPPVKDGRIVRSEIEEHSIRPFSGLFLNTRSPLLGDKNVREALTLLFDFEWTNRALFYDKYLRCVSFFPNSPLAAPDVPDAAELALLEPWRDRIDPAVLGPLPELPETDGSGAIRPLLRRALALFEKSGWKLADGVLRNAAGEPMRLAFPLVSPAQQRIVVPYQKNLAQIGIRLDVRLVDQTQYVNRVRSFDFDIIIASLRQSESPGNEQRNFWSSEAARQEGSRNYAGIGDPVVDAMVERLIAAATFEELTAATRALDRLLRHGRYVVPGWYSKHTRIAWWRERITPPPDRPKRGLDWTSWYAAPRALPPRAADGGR
ncbi:MAG: ABC transporter substrate-binding protein, partial [Desulfovibrio sp.]|nr:ABC transporter substrate-binding protein [Desulfovibrio sp.]